MLKVRNSIKAYAMGIFLFLTFLTTSAMAVPVTLQNGQIVQLNASQLQLLKQQPGIYFVKSSPEKLLARYMLIELPDELGGGFLIARPKELAAAFDAVMLSRR